MVVGASGGVANAFLHHLKEHRGLFDKVVLVDKNNKVLRDRFIDHKALDYIFLRKKIELPEKEKEYAGLIKKYKIGIVLDITDMNSVEILEATNRAGASYVNTAMNDDDKTVADLIYDVYPRKGELNAAPHILCTGMNPGNVNMWARYGIEKFGVPKEIIHFEYDTSDLIKKWHPMITWSVHEFLVEMVRDPSGVALGREKIKRLLPNALENRVNMKNILEPIWKMKKYPFGLTVLHEENLTISYKYDIPSKFIYAINQKTTEKLIEFYEKKHDVAQNFLELEDNTGDILDGADNIGIILDYPDKKVYYFNSIPNMAVIGTNSTYTQVIIGIFAAIFTLLIDNLQGGVRFVEDLYDSHFKHYMFDNMRVQEFVFKKNFGRLKLAHYDPMIKTKRAGHFEHFYLS